MLIAFGDSILGHFESEWAIADGYKLLQSLETRRSDLSTTANCFDTGILATFLSICSSSFLVLIWL